MVTKGVEIHVQQTQFAVRKICQWWLIGGYRTHGDYCELPSEFGVKLSIGGVLMLNTLQK